MERVGGRMYQPVQRFAPETTYEDFYPTYDWAQDSYGHILLIEIPEFTKEDVTVQLDNYGNVTVGGQRRVNDNRYRRFKQVFGVPEDVNYEGISARFDGGLLYIILPKISPAIKGPQRDGGEGRGEAEQKQKQKDKSKLSEERSEGIRERAGGQERVKEEKIEKVGGEEERREEKRKTIEQEGETGGEKREKVGEEAQRKENNRDTSEGGGERRQEKKEVGLIRQAKGKKRVKFGGEKTLEEGQDMREYVNEERELIEEQGKGVGRKEETEEGSEIIKGQAAKKEKIGGEGEEPKKKKREEIGWEQVVKKDRPLGGGEIGGAKREAVRGRGVEGREKESCDGKGQSVVRGNGNRENVEGSTDTRDEAVGNRMGLRRIWESAGWRRALESETVGEILETLRKNKVAVASALIALSAGLYLSHRLNTAGD